MIFSWLDWKKRYILAQKSQLNILLSKSQFNKWNQPGLVYNNTVILLKVVGEWHFSLIHCDILLTLDVMMCTASILNLCAISIDRWILLSCSSCYCMFHLSHKLFVHTFNFISSFLQNCFSLLAKNINIELFATKVAEDQRGKVKKNKCASGTESLKKRTQ